MANALATRVKFRKYSAEQLQNVINNEESNEVEIQVATELLEKMGGAPAPKEAPVAPAKKAAPKAKKAPAPKKEEPKAEKEDKAEKELPADKSPEAAAKRQNKKTTEYVSDEQLTPAEQARLDKAEKEFDERQKNRKTPSKSDKTMKEKAPKAERATKRENLEESNEVPGLKVGSQVTLKEGSEVGTITRVYLSSDGKEKCMVKFGDAKPIKKRVTAVELAEEAKPKAAPKKAKK